MTQAPATGLWGPGDYDGFRTLEEIESDDAMSGGGTYLRYQIMRREVIRDTLLDLAHDLDARGLVLAPVVATDDMVQDGLCGALSDARTNYEAMAGAYERMAEAGSLEFPPIPPDPNTGS